MPRPTLRHMKLSGMTLVVICALSGVSDISSADEVSPGEPIEFETAPSSVLRGSVDVLSVAVAQQGQHIFAAFHDGSVMTLERTSRKPVRLVKCHDGPVSDLAISISGELLISAGYDGTVKAWRLPQFESIAVMSSGHASRVTAVALSPDGRTVASCGLDKTVRIWSVDSGTEQAALAGHDATIRAVAFSPDGTILASADDAGVVRLWDVQSLSEAGTRSGHTGRVRGVALSPDAKTLAGVGEDGVILLWNVEDADAEPKTLNHGTMIWCLAFSPRGSLLATGDAEGTIHMWNVEAERITSSLEGHVDTVTSLGFSADSKTLYSSSHDGSVNAWSSREPPHPTLAKIEIEAGKVWATAISPETSRIAVGGRRGFVRILDLTTGRQVGELKDAHPATVDCLEFSRDGRLIATGGWRSPAVVVWRTDDGTQQRSLEAEGNIRAIEFSADGKRIAAGCDDNQLIVWDVESGEIVKKVNAHALPVYDVSFSPDGKTIATCSGNWTESKPGRIKLWKAGSLTEIARLDGHEVAVRAAVFHPDGKRLASVSENGVIRVWDVQTRTELAVLRNSSGARTLDWSPDGDLLAAGLHDGTTNVWDLEAGVVTRRFGGNDDTFSVRFVPDGSVLCGAGGGKQITLWDTSDLTGGAVERIVDSVRNWVKEVP